MCPVTLGMKGRVFSPELWGLCQAAAATGDVKMGRQLAIPYLFSSSLPLEQKPIDQDREARTATQWQLVLRNGVPADALCAHGPWISCPAVR